MVAKGAESRAGAAGRLEAGGEALVVGVDFRVVVDAATEVVVVASLEDVVGAGSVVEVVSSS
jgi:hypothetical protein